MQTKHKLGVSNALMNDTKDRILGLSIRLEDGCIATGWKILLTPFGYHIFNAMTIFILMIVIGVNWADAYKGQVEPVATIIKSFSIYSFIFAFWAVFHQRLLASSVYFTGLLITYFLFLQFLSNAMYGSMAQLAIICLFQFCLLAMLTVLITIISKSKGFSPIDTISN